MRENCTYGLMRGSGRCFAFPLYSTENLNALCGLKLTTKITREVTKVTKPNIIWDCIKFNILKYRQYALRYLNGLFVKQVVHFFIKFFNKLLVVYAGSRAGKASVYFVDIAIFINEQYGWERKECIQRRKRFCYSFFICQPETVKWTVSVKNQIRIF